MPRSTIPVNETPPPMAVQRACDDMGLSIRDSSGPRRNWKRRWIPRYPAITVIGNFNRLLHSANWVQAKPYDVRSGTSSHTFVLLSNRFFDFIGYDWLHLANISGSLFLD
jgi:hypothetical protein